MSNTEFSPPETETAKAEMERMRPDLDAGRPYKCSKGWIPGSRTDDPKEGRGRRGHVLRHTDGSTLTVWPPVEYDVWPPNTLVPIVVFHETRYVRFADVVTLLPPERERP